MQKLVPISQRFSDFRELFEVAETGTGSVAGFLCLTAARDC